MAAGRENGRVRRKKRENLNNRMALIGVTLVVFSLAIAVHLKGLDLEQKDLNYRLREESLMKQVEDEKARAGSWRSTACMSRRSSMWRRWPRKSSGWSTATRCC